MATRKLLNKEKRFLEKFLSLLSGVRDMESLQDFYEDDGTNSNVFNNAPRALICVSIKGQVDLLLRLWAAGRIVK